MSNPTELLQAAVHALKTEKDSERAKQLSAEILDTYPDSKEAGRARMIIDEINAVAIWSAKKAKQTKETEGSPAASATMPFLGVLLRFLGMIVIGVSAFYLFFSDGETIIMSLIAGSFGAAMHFAGRKIAPDARWASAAGGVVVGVGSIALIVAVACAMLFVLGLVIAFLSMWMG